MYEEQGKQTRSKFIHVQNPRKAQKLEALVTSIGKKIGFFFLFEYVFSRA